MSGVVIEELDSSEEDFGTPTSRGSTEDGFHSPHGSEKDLQGAMSAAVGTESSSQANANKEEGAPSSGVAAAESSGPTETNEAGAREEPPSASGESAVAESGELMPAQQESLGEAEALKAEGNDLYKEGQFLEALAKYEAALDVAPERASQQRAVFFANSAAVRLKLEEWAEAAKDCSAALELEPPVVLQAKVLGRRSMAYEKLDDLDRALADHEKVLTLDEGNASSRAAARRLKPIVEERREKMKEEMLGKLKDLGNTVLGKFGMSLDNFKAEKDPETGSYSINFKQ
jgi:tetratricopeptide (TPR) repeat protein